MAGLAPQEITTFFLAAGCLLGAARVGAEIAERLRQPAVIGEILAGLVLGPTVFGALLPEWQASLFPDSGHVNIAISSLSTLAVALFLFVAGMEIDLSTAWSQRKTAVSVSVMGIVVPLLVGFLLAISVPEWLGTTGKTGTVLFSLFFGVAMAITALPVIAKILFDLKIMQTDMGTTIISAAIVDDLSGWIIFAFVLALMGVGESHFNPAVTGVLTVGFAIFMLTFGRWSVNRSLPWIQAHTQWPAGVLAFALTSTLISAAFTEWVGVHAIFGAFLFGVAIGDSPHLRQRTRATIHQFISFIFAPIFFASIGLRADFLAHFDLLLVLVVLVIASAGKILGCAGGARWAGFGRREAWAVGFGMNARGAMEIVLGLLALQSGIITERLFVALVVMALVTSMTSGVLIQRSLGRKRTLNFAKFISSKTFIPNLDTSDRFDVIRRLATVAAESASMNPEHLSGLLLSREALFNSSMSNGIAIAHTRLKELRQPVIALGLSRTGVEWDTRDGQPVHAVLVIFAPDDPALHLSLLASVARTFRRPDAAQSMAATATTLTQLRAFLRVESTPHTGGPEHPSLP